MEAQAKTAAVKNLKQILPHLESEGESVRRCFGIIIENFHVSGRRLAAMEKKTMTDVEEKETGEAVLEFLHAAQEIGTNLERLLELARQIESATNEMAKGAQNLVEGHAG